MNADFDAGHFDTGYIGTHLGHLLDHRRPKSALSSDARDTRKKPHSIANVPEGMNGIYAPMSGVVVNVAAAPGDVVQEGATIAVFEAMKMEHVLPAPRAMRIGALTIKAGDATDQGALLGWGIPMDGPLGHATRETKGAMGDWSEEVSEIGRRRQIALAMGGAEKVARQHKTGRLTARERIAKFVDAGSFREIGVLTAFATYDENGRETSLLPANFVAGTARVDGRKIALGVDDFTRRGGAGDTAIHEKQVYLEEYAREMRLPMVRLLDGQSGGGSVKMIRDAGFTYVPVNPGWDAVVDNLSLVPVAAAALGPTVGLGAARFVMSHLAVLVEGLGQVFTAGPPVVKHATGEDLTKEELGGADVHRSNGTAERIVPDEATAFAVIRAFLSYLPSSVFELPPVRSGTDPTERREEMLLSAIPRNKRRPYAIDPILDAIFDASSITRYAEYGDSTVTALARLDGHPVGVISSDPMKGAAMSVAGAQAIGRLVDLCDTFHLPIVSLTDQAGVNIGSAAERGATIRAGSRAIAAVYQARVPQAEIIMRRVYGVGGAGIVNRHRANRSWAWPSGNWGSLPARGGIEAAFRAEIEASADREATIARFAMELDALASPFRTAEHFGTQDLIDPRDTRALLCDWVHDAYRVLPELVGPPSFGCRP
jgi:acetyl-CoA carboxylase carboxyltransferase component